MQASPNLFAVDLIIIPANLSNTHWVCAVIYVKEKRIVYYDSMSVSIAQMRIHPRGERQQGREQGGDADPGNMHADGRTAGGRGWDHS